MTRPPTRCAGAAPAGRPAGTGRRSRPITPEWGCAPASGPALYCLEDRPRPSWTAAAAREAFLESINGALSGLRLRRASAGPGCGRGGWRWATNTGFWPGIFRILPEPHGAGAPGQVPGGAGCGLGGLVRSPGIRRPGGTSGARLAVLCPAVRRHGERDRGRPERAKVRCVSSRGFCRQGMPGAEALGTLNDLYVLRETGRIFPNRTCWNCTWTRDVPVYINGVLPPAI